MREIPPDARSGPVPLASDRLTYLRDRLRVAEGLLLCLDYDGTLAPIVPDPDDAEMPADNRRALRRLRSVPAVEVALVSGRSLADLRDRVGIDGVHYAGNHGLELEVGGKRVVAEEARPARPAIERTVETLRDELAGVPGAELEDKGLTATAHYRRVPSGRVGDVRDAVTRATTGEDHLAVTGGKRVLELRPDVEFGKDRAVRHLAREFPDHLASFVGDDTTDEDAFQYLEPTGVGIHVGDDDTAAGLRVPDPEGVTELLVWLIVACTEEFGPAEN